MNRHKICAGIIIALASLLLLGASNQPLLPLVAAIQNGTITVSNGVFTYASFAQQTVSEPMEWSEDGAAQAALTVTVGDGLAFEFIDAQTRDITARAGIPTNATLTQNPVVYSRLAVTQTGGGNANVYLQLDCNYLSDGDLFTQSYSETLNQAVAITDTLNRMHTISWTLDATKMAAGDHMTFKLSRLGGHASDTFTGRVGGIKIGRLEFKR